MTKNHYVNNQGFLEALVEYREKCKDWKGKDEPKPMVSNYIAQCIMLIAEKLSRKPNFYSYSFREDMVGDAIKNCIMYIDNFDPEVSQNPFAYFTQITYFAFIQRINKERKQLYVKYKSTEEMSIHGDYEQFEMVDGDGNDSQFELYDNISEFINNYEKKHNITNKKKQKKSKLPAGLEKYMVE